MKTLKNKHGMLALLPFLVFAVFYLGLSLWTGDFYRVPMTVAFLVASAVAICMHPPRLLERNVGIFARGMGNENIMIMCLIFILAGAFAAAAQEMGAVDATVKIAGSLIPPSLILPGIFIVSCFISLAVGTSCGTIAAMTPIAISMTGKLGITPEIMLGCVIGGAMFGDNISMISDTTIAATRCLNISMRDKFLSNISFALPAAIVSLLIYIVFSLNIVSQAAAFVQTPDWQDIIRTIPYLLILVLALCGFNVMALLFGASVVAVIIGILLGNFDFIQALSILGKGCLNMAETLFVAILAGGLLAVVKYYGGVAWMMQKIESMIKSKIGCELGTALLVSVVNLFTANNTVSIVIAGPIAKELAQKYSCNPKRIASILDASSCILQGVIPYGAQMLIATGIANGGGMKVSPVKLIMHCHYQQILLAAMLLWIFIRRKNNQNA